MLTNKTLMATLRCGHAKPFERREAVGVAVGRSVWCSKCCKDSQVVETKWISPHSGGQ